MVTLFVLIAVVCGITVGLVTAAVGVRKKSLNIINNIHKMSEAYTLVISEIVTGQISIHDIGLLQTSGVVGIVADEILFYMEEGLSKEEIVKNLYSSLNSSLEDEHLDFVQPLDKFDLFEELDDTNDEVA